MASHYYRYTVAPFDDNYPEPLPADPYLVPGMLAARHLGVPPLPYTNGVIWDSDTQSWLRENGLAAAIKDEEGRMVPWDIGGQVFAHMCPVEQWRAKLRETTRKLVGEHAMAGVYLDCLAATPAMPCYDPRHGHSLHGGDHRAKDLRRLLEELRLDARRLSPGAAFFTEEIGEQFLDVMDGFLTLDLTRAGLHPGQQVFPVFSVVYHPYALNFGSDASLDLDPAWFALQMGTLFTWGAVPLLSATVAQPPQEGDANSEMLRDLVQAYHRVGTPFLQGGQWERLVTMPDTGVRPAASLALTSRPHTVDWAPAGSSPRQWQGPAVLGSAWRQGNTVGVALVNITPEAQTATLWADCAGLGLPESSQVTALWPDSASVPPGGEGSYRLVLAPRRVAVLALADVSRTWRRQPLDRCPWDLLAAVDGPLPERAETDGCLRACDDGPVVHQFGPDGVALTATAIDAQGLLVRRIAHQAEVRGPEADGQSLPRRRLDQPFALLRCLPHQVIRGEPRVTVLGGDDDWLLCRVAGSCRIGFSRAGIVCRRTGDGKESEFATATAAEVPAGPGETVVAFWAAGDELAEAVAERAAACSTAVTEADGVRLAVAALTEAPSPEAVAALSRALAAHLEACGKAPGLAAPGSALAALVQRTNALVSGLTGMEAVLLAEDDWLTPGLPKDVTLVTRGVALPGEARFLGLADVPAGSLDVSALPASPGARVVTARALLRSEDYVERLVPVAGQVRGAVGPEEAVLSPLLWLDSNRPVAVSSSRQAPVVLAGQECATELTVRNLSPAELNLAVTTAVPPGWTITVSPPELRLAPLASRPVQLVLAAPPEARSQSVAFRLKTLWGVGQERGFVTEVRCAVQERIGVLRQEKREPPAPTPARLRQRNQVVFWVRAGEEVAVTVRNLRVTQYQDAATVRLLGPTLAPVATAQVAVDRQAVLTTGAATADGVYHLLVDVGSGSVEIAADGRPFAEVASAESPLSLFCSPIRRWFYVPRSAQQFLLHARDGGVAETARIRVLSPAGTVVFERDGNWAGEAHRIPVLPEAAGGVWLLECQPLQDVSLWLAGDVCPYLSDDPSEVPVPSAESGRP
jgi:hypothetical protein